MPTQMLWTMKAFVCALAQMIRLRSLLKSEKMASKLQRLKKPLFYYTPHFVGQYWLGLSLTILLLWCSLQLLSAHIWWRVSIGDIHQVFPADFLRADRCSWGQAGFNSINQSTSRRLSPSGNLHIWGIRPTFKGRSRSTFDGKAIKTFQWVSTTTLSLKILSKDITLCSWRWTYWLLGPWWFWFSQQDCEFSQRRRGERTWPCIVV